MRNKLCTLLAAALATIALTAAGEDAPRVTERVEHGVVESIVVVPGRSEAPSGAGAVLGGIAGGVIGHQIGGGRGKDVATIAGALGGAYAGNQVERSRERDRYRATVRLDGGAKLEVDDAAELRVGDRVRVVNGSVSRE